ncbi:MAG: hypothetical protein EU542_07775 [Promethearchaeota archaeon]|nr:MAG: hypothetical protein EU542_07775 [Candidatus Lokiarchaeota archaeon]
MSDKDIINKEYKEKLKKKIKEQLKKELVEEIFQELKLEEDELTSEISTIIKNKPQPKIKESNVEPGVEITPPEFVEKEKNLFISVQAILKIASHALKYAHSKIPKHKWVEVIGLLAGYMDYENKVLYIEDAYPMGHGSAIYAEIKDYKNFVRAFNDIKKNNLFICGWYHSHPSYGTFMSDEDIGTQTRYQKLWKKAVALVIDPYEIDGTSLGFEIYRANLETREWFPLSFDIKGDLDVRMLPEILAFMNPIIEGKPAYLEYDEL